MRWIRQHIRPAAWLALAALAVHVVVTFGHVHLEWLSAPSAATTAIAAAEIRAPAKADGARTPAQPHRTRVAQDLCAVCASASLLGTLVLPVVQKLVPPRAIVRIHEVNRSDGTRLSELRSSSHARAPPSA